MVKVYLLGSGLIGFPQMNADRIAQISRITGISISEICEKISDLCGKPIKPLPNK
jgi:hypothetical protein